ncbi:EAL domain-containing protein [Synechocystis sp. FACHB-383]|nr:EAL domain-containing protein [Synechocystis sp. FACHB-383]
MAEGIETEKHLTQLHWLGCDAGQGYYFAHPIPSEDLLDFLAIQMSRWLMPVVTELPPLKPA